MDKDTLLKFVKWIDYSSSHRGVKKFHLKGAWSGLCDTFKNLNPLAIADAVLTVATATTRCGLRSSATTDHVVPRTLSKFDELAFAYIYKSRCLEAPSRA